MWRQRNLMDLQAAAEHMSTPGTVYVPMWYTTCPQKQGRYGNLKCFKNISIYPPNTNACKNIEF